jgi:hypothetical protein
VAVNLDVVLGLYNVDAVVHVKEALSLEGDIHSIVDEVEKCVGSGFVASCDGKVVDLSHEQDPLTINDAGVEARLVNGRCQPE